jgi:hypothetical protein
MSATNDKFKAMQARIDALIKVIEDHCLPNAEMDEDLFLVGLLTTALKEASK